MVFRFEFSLRLSLRRDRSRGGLSNERDKSVMTKDARDLANLINQNEEHRRKQQDVQLHRAQVMKAKAPEFWRQFVEILEEEQKKFNETLTAPSSKYAIEYIGVDMSGPPFTRKVVRPKYPSVSLTVRLEPEASAVSINGVKQFNDSSSSREELRPRILHLHIDEDDNISIRDKGGTISLHDLALEVIKYFLP